jgi:predicted exporter
MSLRSPPVLRFTLWLTAVLMLLGTALSVLPKLQIETDITAMLPQTTPDAVVEQSLQRFAAAAGRRNVYLIEAASFAAARKAAAAFAASLRASSAFEDVEFERGIDADALDAVLEPYRYGLLAGADRAALTAGRAQALADTALRALYTPAGLMRVRPFGEDPLNLYGDYLQGLIAAPGRLQLRDGVLSGRHDDHINVLVTATLKDSPFALGAQGGATAAVDAATAAALAAAPQIQVYRSGVLQHAVANSQRAKREIGVFGSLSLLGVVLVCLYCFGSLRPLALVLVTLAVGTLASIVTVQLLFGQIHLLALVFGSSLIGVAVDYAIHFFSDRFRGVQPWSGAIAIDHVGTAILVGMLTTSLGYLALIVPPFPGLRQMAVFSVVGVLSAGLTALLAFPLLAGHSPRPPPPALAATARWLSRRRPPRGRVAAVTALVLAGVIGFGLSRLSFIDDVRALQSSPAPLLAQETAVQQRLGGGTDTRFFLVEGADAEALLRHEEQLRERLDALIADQRLSGYLALSRAVPSAQRQRQNRALLATQVYGDSGVLQPLLAGLGYTDDSYQRLAADFAAADGRILRLSHWLDSPLAGPFRGLWVGSTDRGVASVVALIGVRDLDALRAGTAGLDSVRLIDRVADISTVLAHYRRIALFGLAAALLAIAVVVALRYGLRVSPRLLLAPVGGCVLTLATLGLLGIPGNLFTVLALLLVLGLGVDYTVFLREGAASRQVTIMAISAAALTTVLAFGTLSASATPFIRSLGLAALLGVTYTWLIAIVLSAAPAPRVPQ